MQDPHKDVSVEQKLALIQQVRTQYIQNQNDLMRRESILEIKEESRSKGGTLKIRYLLAAVLTAIIICCHQTGIKIGGLSMEQVFLTLEQDYEDTLLAWSNALIQTPISPSENFSTDSTGSPAPQ